MFATLVTLFIFKFPATTLIEPDITSSPPFVVRPLMACIFPPCSTPNVNRLLFTFTFPLATVRPLFTVAPAFRKAAKLVVRVLLIAVGLFRMTCVPDILFPPQVNVPAPMLDRFPLTVAVDRATVEVMPPPPPPPGVSPLMLLTVRLLIATAGIVAVGWMTGTHSPSIWMDETLLVM